MKNDSIIKRFFSHNVTLIVLALLISFSIWFAINASSDTGTNVTISDIPVTIELPQEAIDDGLQVFSGSDVKCSVDVNGNRITVGSLTSSDIQITSDQASSIIAPGTYNLNLTARKTGLKSNYNIVSSVTPSTITVFVDKLKTKAFDIENQIAYKVDDGYYANASLSQASVKVSGPESEVSKIEKVVIQGKIDGVLNSTRTFDKKLVFLDADGKSLDLALINADIESVTVSLSVLPVKKVNLSVDVANAPSSYPKISVSPTSINIAGPENALKSIGDSPVKIGTVDFSTLRNEKTTLKFDITLPRECKNISNETSASVTIDLSDYKRKELTCSIKNTIDDSKYYCDFSDENVTVVIYGPQKYIDTIEESDISISTDFTDKLSDVTKTATSIDVPLIVKLSDKYSDCWCYGTYSVKANISEIE